MKLSMKSSSCKLPSAISAVLLTLLLGAVTPVFAAVPPCRSVTACLFELNAGGGFALEGVSSKNDALIGKTSAVGTSALKPHFGVAGFDASTDGSAYNAGTFGYSAHGTGTKGQSKDGIGVVGGSDSWQGVYGFSHAGTGVFGDGEPPGAIGVVGFSNGGYGAYAFSRQVAFDATVDPYAASVDPVAIQATVIDYGNFGPNLLVGTRIDGGGSQDVISVDEYGNMMLAGSLTQNGTPLFRTHNTDGADVLTYGTRNSSPSLENTGEAQLRGGLAFVKLDPTFAGAIDPQTKYLVFLTPEADSHGLYVNGTSRTGFSVRENSAGHSNLAFEYRIVAKPFDSRAARVLTPEALPLLRRGSRNALAPHALEMIESVDRSRRGRI